MDYGTGYYPAPTCRSVHCITPEYSISDPAKNRRLLPLSLKELHSAIFFNLPVFPYRERTDVNVWVTEYWNHKGCLGFEVAGEMTSKAKGPQAPLIVCVPQWIINESSWRTAQEQKSSHFSGSHNLKKKKIWEEVGSTKRWKQTFFTVCF